MRSFLLILLSIIGFTSCQTNRLIQLLQESKHPIVQKVVATPHSYEVQILYTQINRDAQNKPYFRSFEYQVDSSNYFYPASMAKMPVAFAAVEKINKLRKQLNNNDLSIHSILYSDSARAPQTIVVTDTSAANRFPSVAHYAKKVFIVSDNDANNRLYEFVGQDEINKTLHEKGFLHTKITHRLAVGEFSMQDNRYTNPIMLLQNGKIAYEQAEQMAKMPNTTTQKNVKKGKGYYKGETLINEPFDFSEKNAISIRDLEGQLRAVLFPEVTPEKKRFDFTENDYKWLYQVLSELPRESQHPKYDLKENFDGFCKFFLYGDTKNQIPEHIRIFNKVGFAYGTLTDCAYIVDFKNNIEFLLTATIHVNQDGIFNDDKYEYETIGEPFLAEIGRIVYQYELKRKRSHAPNLTKWKVEKYD
jgi:beta-lactamase class A